MEFPENGKHCSVKDCKLLDFLPFVCEHCQATFCKEHFHMVSHECLNTENAKLPIGKSINFQCSKESCKETSLIEMPCIKCKQHFCLTHRHHGCLELSETEKTQKLKKWQIPKKQFAEAKAKVDQQIADSLRKSKNTAMANKVQLMRVKGSAIGPKNVPTSERCYFLVHLPLTVKNKHIGTSKGVFVNMQWTIGKCIDSMADTFKISTNTNATNMSKLQLFHHSNGTLIHGEMDTPLIKLFENSTIVDGQRVILEYSNNVPIDTSLYK
ncbi:AN1-type zinc finger protein 1-like [Cataglyphis hispanica]|uniref:AN1-type zinc finger protein 1-like n=1 Tax=Cataglyphis hispanica TaxID=1086592 RepID=UPI0021802DE6|nr:AN1-type zinc finger protein 1-like [Cataglyphis hispanica]